MIQFPIPKPFNGAKFIDELKNAGIEFNDIPKEEEGVLILNLDESLENKIKLVISKHDGSDSLDPKSAILQKLGLTEAEAKLLLA